MKFLSNNTKHGWVICKSLNSADKPVMIYYKHSQMTDYYHRRWKMWSVVKAMESIKQYDSYVLGMAG